MLTMFIMAYMASPISAKAIIEHSWKQTLVVGHRGAAAYKPENTIESFEEAIACKAVAVECDVHVSKDGELIVMHDDTLDRTTRLKGAVKDTSAAEMIAAGVPTLAEYLRTTKDRIVSVIELKDGADVVPKTLALVKKQKMLSQTILFSFNADFIKQAKQIEPKAYAVWLNSEPKDLEAHFARCKEIKADAVGVGYPAATAALVAEAHKRKMPVFVWTVPPGPEIDRLKALKVNFIITNHPRDVIGQLKKN